MGFFVSFYRAQSTIFRSKIAQIQLNHITNKYHLKSPKLTHLFCEGIRKPCNWAKKETVLLSDKIIVMHMQISKQMTHLSGESSTEIGASLKGNMQFLQQQRKKGRKYSSWCFYPSSLFSVPLALPFFLFTSVICNVSVLLDWSNMGNHTGEQLSHSTLGFIKCAVFI